MHGCSKHYCNADTLKQNTLRLASRNASRHEVRFVRNACTLFENVTAAVKPSETTTASLTMQTITQTDDFWW